MIQIHLDKCTGCRRCETACAFFHTGRVNNHLSRIKVLHLYELGVDGPVVCQQCKERYCMKCPVHALSIGPHGQINVSATVCTLCGACEVNCPIGAIELFDGFVYVCDLCGGRPRCVDACTEGAVLWEKDEIESVSQAELKSETKKMNSGQKRQKYISGQAEKVREKWRKARA